MVITIDLTKPVGKRERRCLRFEPGFVTTIEGFAVDSAIKIKSELKIFSSQEHFNT